MEEKEQLPCWTEEEVDAFAAEEEQYFHNNPPSAVDWNLEASASYTGANIEWVF